MVLEVNTISNRVLGNLLSIFVRFWLVCNFLNLFGHSARGLY